MSFNEQFQQFPIIETERFLLRELQPDDAEEYYNYFSDHEVTRFWGYDSPKDVKTVMNTFVRFSNAFKRKEMIVWGISSKTTNKIIGTCILGNFVRGSMANLSYNLAREQWKQGIMEESLRAVIPFGFHHLELHRIQAAVMPENIASIHVLEKIEFKKEGLLREYSFGTLFTDTLMYSLLAGEFKGASVIHLADK
ncbi:GNAT family N-acetyltransferase [Paenibacillus rhizovicinus]|uniref:GNAT family N-acetyltransferase n=1 Tax=Paenibacillus rhizovicinus TaxID=2704463 RepID=A0A6C0P5C8_9BACL|nr:GNAT family protein [Paenibacillus rhizovicinus]QHW33687.1 GNAT family N-acetyltransferase [Paenibacillus rhizovicinus]